MKKILLLLIFTLSSVTSADTLPLSSQVGHIVSINGDGSTSRDFCYIKNAVQANLLAATSSKIEAVNQVYNIAFGERTSLNSLYQNIYDGLYERMEHLTDVKPQYREFRKGDVLHSLADISKSQELLGYQPSHSVSSGLNEALDWYVNKFNNFKNPF